ncbi:MAG: hypothetical protein JNM88_02885 [Chitinophagaceae bacterium]|nr:hypothetical protein [Chitinophagaceae bacterium]
MKLNLRSASLLALFLALSTLFITSCQKEQSQNGTPEEQEQAASRASSEADAEAEIIFNGTFDDAMGVNDEVGVGGTGVFGRPNACPTVTIVRPTANPFPVIVTLDFGPGCTGPDGHFRKGKVITNYTGRLIFPGSMATTTFDGFYFDSVKVQGTHKITNTSTPFTTPPAPDRKYKVEVIDGKLTRPSGNFVEWSSVKFIAQVEGLGTNNPLDDIFKIEGNARGRVKRGALIVLWESNIIEPLMKRFNCRWIVKGKIRTIRGTLAVTSPWVAVLDFGNGSCDNQAVVIINGIPHQITLP